MKIGIKIKKLRVKRRWSKYKLAQVANLTCHTVMRLEDDVTLDAKLDTLVKIAKAFDISLASLFKDVNY